jgi:hypothetical protein
MSNFLASLLTPPTVIETYVSAKRQFIVSATQNLVNQYLREWTDFWNQSVTAPQSGQFPPPGPQSAYSPADKLLFLGTLAVQYLTFAAQARATVEALANGTKLPGPPTGYQFLCNADGTAYLQQMSVSGTPPVAAWANVLPSAAGIAAATAAGITIPAALLPVTA